MSDVNDSKQSLPKPTEVTNIEVTLGKSVHKVHVEENAEPESNTERRHNPAPVSVQVGPSMAGLVGMPAQIMNMSAVVFVLIMMFLMYRDFSSSVREDRALNREAQTNMVSAMGLQTSTLNATLTANQVKLDLLITSNQALLSEIRLDRKLNAAQPPHNLVAPKNN